MAAPELKLTMLGTTGSGKTTFLLGMYNTLTTGLDNYFVYTEDPDEGLDLEDWWSALTGEGTLPLPTKLDGTKKYRFVFNRGVSTLVTIEWLDYRGGAMSSRGSDATDTLELRAQLAASDSIYLVLDGGNIASWLDGKTKLPGLMKELKISNMSTAVNQAIRYRQDNGLPLPSLAVVITKSDLLASQGRSVGDALAQVLENLKTIVPVAYVPDMTTLVCPVQLGDFGAPNLETVAIKDIDPVGLHLPMIFSLMHYLTEGRGARKHQIESSHAARSDADRQISALNQGFMAYFRGRRIAGLRDVAAAQDKAIAERQQQDRAAESLIGVLAKELEGYPIVRDGRVEL